MSNKWTATGCPDCGAGQGLSHSGVDCGRIRDLRVENDALRAVLAEKQDALVVSDTRWMETHVENERLRGILRLYGNHWSNCALHHGRDCTCGYHGAIADLDTSGS